MSESAGVALSKRGASQQGAINSHPPLFHVKPDVLISYNVIPYQKIQTVDSFSFIESEILLHILFWGKFFRTEI